MSESLAAARELAQSDRSAYLEQRLFVYSPLGTFWTAFVIFVLLVGLYALAAATSGVTVVAYHGQAPGPSASARFALQFSLLVATVLGIQRYARVRERADFAAFACVLKGGAEDARRTTALTPDDARLTRATVLGLMAGVLLCWTIVPVSPPRQSAATYAWFAAVTILVSILFARGVTLTRGGGRGMRETIDNRLMIDLLRIDRLAVIGRSAARGALVWFVISAVICLFFIGGGSDDFTIALLLGCAAMGIWIFVATMERVHRRIRATKTEELERVRAEIDAARSQAGVEETHRLQGLLAYEARIASVHEWPFDQTTLVRVVASALILAVPWFGQAVAAFAVEHLAAVAK